MFKREDGSVVVLVLIITATLIILGTSLLVLSGSETFQVNRQEHKLQAYYLARSGADSIAAWLIANPETVNYLAGRESAPLELAGGEVAVQVSEETDGSILIESTAVVKGYSEKVNLSLLRGGQGRAHLVFDNAVFSKNSIELLGSAQIRGSAGTNSSLPNQVHLGWSTRITEELYLGPGSVWQNVLSGARPDPRANLGPNDQSYQSQEYVYNLPEEKVFPLPDFPSFPTNLPWMGNYEAGWNPSPPYYITGDGEYNNLNVLSELRIDLGNGIRTIRANNLNVSGSGRIILEGSGTLHLYVENSFILANGAHINNLGNPDKLLLLYKGEQTVTIAGNTRLYANIYIERAGLHLGGSNAVHGNIVCGGLGQDVEVTIDGDASAFARVLYAPNSNVKLSGSGKLRGAIIANSFYADGGTWVEYSPDIKDVILPIPIEAESNEGFHRGIWQQ